MTESAEWVSDNQRLAELCNQWLQQKVIALDTEFIRTRTFFPNIGLLQIADNRGIYLIDPLAITQVEPLKKVLTDAGVVKVIHSCSEDLEVFDYYLSVLPEPLFDTQIAAAFAGYGASVSYANLIKEVRGDIIPKQETRSDWLQRPLSQSQLDYAALDVEHLIEVYHSLIKQLNDKQRLLWVETECQQAINKVSQNRCFDQYYLRIKSAWKLSRPQLAILRDLCIWREEEARKLNVPRNRLLKDNSLLDIARMQPKVSHVLYKVRDMQPRFVNKYGDYLVALIETALRNPNTFPALLPRPLSAEQNALFKVLKEKVVDLSEAMGMPPEYLARKHDLESLVYQAENDTIVLPEGLRGWREDVIANKLLEQL